MELTTRVGLFVGAAALTLTSVSYADASLEARLAKAEAELAQLKGDWMTEQRADEIRSLVQDVLADADTRSSLLQAGMTAGYDNGFVLGSADGNFNLKLNGQLQTRFIYNNQDDDSSSDSDRWGFENTRTKLMFSGNVMGQTWGYYIEGDFTREDSYGDGGAFFLDDAWISHDCGNGWTALVGQMKVPVLREWLVHSQHQLLVERSNAVYINPAASRTQGIAVDYKAEQWHFVAAITDGASGQNSQWSAYDTEFSISGRVEFLAQGNWDQFADFTSPQGSEQGILIGVGGHWQKAEYGTGASNEVEAFVLTADVSFEFDGANIFAALYYTNLDNDSSLDRDILGFVIHGGYYFSEDFEAFLRYEFNDYDVDGAEDLSLITIGFNKYWGDNVTWTTDLGFGIDEVYSASDVTGWRDDGSDEDGQVVFRSQLQLTF